MPCSYQVSGGAPLPWHTKVDYWAASGQYDASRICGLCFAFKGTQATGSPIPTATEYAQCKLRREWHEIAVFKPCHL